MITPRDRLALVLNEIRLRQTKRFVLADYCFKEQLAFIRDPAQFKTAVCSRRAGKTIACAADLIDTALQFPEVVCLYITMTRKNAKKIIWPELLRINRRFELNARLNETDLSMTLPNGSVIYCSGAKDKSEIENFRGLALKKVYVDECQSFRAYIEDLIDDVLSKALFDYAGTLCLIGTPGPVPAGYFAECAGAVSDKPEKAEAYSHHFWTMFQNPHLEKKSGKPVLKLVEDDCKRMGVPITHPKIQRECFGKWEVDKESLIFKYDSAKNHFDALPSRKGSWEYVIGVDLGHDDADAIAVIGWNDRKKESYLIEELVRPKQGITELADQLEKMVKTYDPLKIVVDSGGLGKKIAKEIQRRRSIGLEPAEKSRKMEYIELLNDAMRTRRFMAKKTSAFAQDCLLVEKDFDKTTPEKIVISDKYHSDICDAVLYAFRESLHWLSEEVPDRAKPGTPEAAKEEEDEMEEAAEAAAMPGGNDGWGPEWEKFG